MPDEKIHPRYAHEHSMNERIIPVVKCLGRSRYVAEPYKYDTCVHPPRTTLDSGDAGGQER